MDIMALTVELGFTCVAPTLVMYGHVPGNDGLKSEALTDCVPFAYRHRPPLPATP